MEGSVQDLLHIDIQDCSITKQDIRIKVWDYLEQKNLANFPRPVHNRIPNFQGASQAGQSLSKLTEFQEAKVVKVNPDKPQEEVRFQVLNHHKELLVPTPRLKKGLFNRLRNNGNSMKELRNLSTRKGIDNVSTPVSLEEDVSIDFIVLGSVAVDKLGHRIGKGEGFADLEFALAASHQGASGAVSDETVVATTVHDCQVFDELPEHMFGDHDVPVDIIVTPTSVYKVENKLNKPSGINWDILTEEKIKQIPLLQQLQKATSVKPVLTQLTRRKSKRKEAIGFCFTGIPQETRISEFKEILRKTGAKITFVTWKAYKNSALVFFEGSKEDILNCLQDLHISGEKIDFEEILSEEADKEEGIKDNCAPGKRSAKVNKNEFGIFFGKIPKQCKKSEFRKILAERDVALEHLNWNGRNGYASAFWTHPDETILNKLHGLKIQDYSIVVELFKRPDTNESEDQALFAQEQEATSNTIWKTEVEIKLNEPILQEKSAETYICFESSKPISESFPEIFTDVQDQPLPQPQIHDSKETEDKMDDSEVVKIDVLNEEEVGIDNNVCVIETDNQDIVNEECLVRESKGERRKSKESEQVRDKGKSEGSKSSQGEIIKETKTSSKQIVTKNKDIASASIPSYCDKIRDIRHSPDEDVQASNKYHVQEAIVPDKGSRSSQSFADVAHQQVKRNASSTSNKPQTNKMENNNKPNRSPKPKQEEAKGAKTKSLAATPARFLSIDTEEDRERMRKNAKSSPVRNSKNVKEEEKSKKEKSKRSKSHHRDSSSKRGSSSDTKSQTSSSRDLKAGGQNGAGKHANETKSSQKSVMKESPNPSKEKENCVIN